jgi:serine/threonine protein kinase
MLQIAERNKGEVVLFEDTEDNCFVVAKVMPMSWVCTTELEFAQTYPNAIEQPWLDIKTNMRLTRQGFPHICSYQGVYTSSDKMYFVQGFANGGDLFEYVDKRRKRNPSKGLTFKPPSSSRKDSKGNAQVGSKESCSSEKSAPEWPQEQKVRMLFKKLLVALQDFHTVAKMAHRDLSLENVMLHWPNGATGDDVEPELRLVDFGMARLLANPNWVADEIKRPNLGKASYTAPELHDLELADSQEAIDIFAAGVILYCLLTTEYPWIRTRRGEDKAHDYYLDSGVEAFLRKRIGGRVVADVISPGAMALLKDLLQRDPKKRGRFTNPSKDRRSVWRHAWWTAPL